MLKVFSCFFSFVEVCSTATPFILNLGGIRTISNTQMGEKKQKPKKSSQSAELWNLLWGGLAPPVTLAGADHSCTHRLQVSDALGELPDTEQEIQPLPQLGDFTHLHRIKTELKSTLIPKHACFHENLSLLLSNSAVPGFA